MNGSNLRFSGAKKMVLHPKAGEGRPSSSSSSSTPKEFEVPREF
jgi:hypothetical protein